MRTLSEPSSQLSTDFPLTLVSSRGSPPSEISEGCGLRQQVVVSSVNRGCGYRASASWLDLPCAEQYDDRDGRAWSLALRLRLRLSAELHQRLVRV